MARMHAEAPQQGRAPAGSGPEAEPAGDDPGVLVHLHIPKNAGTTLSRMVKLHLLLERPTRLSRHRLALGFYDVDAAGESRHRRAEMIAALDESRRRRVLFYEAHCGWGVHERMGRSARYFTLLRDPVSRTLSVFAFRKQNGTLDPQTPLEAFVREHPRDVVWHVDNAQVRYLAGERGDIDDRPVGTCDAAMLEVARGRLEEMFFFGLVERFDESVVLMHRALGWMARPYGQSNVTRRPKARSELSEGELALIRSHNELDVALLEHARELFARRVQAAGAEFEGRVERYRRSLERAAPVMRRAYDLLPRVRRGAQRWGLRR